MKSSKRLIKSIDLKTNLFNFIWLSAIGIAGIIVNAKTNYFSIEYNYGLPEVYILWIIAVIAGIIYSLKLMKVSTSKTIADLAYSLPVSKTKYYLSKILSAAIAEIATLITVGVVCSIIMMDSMPWILTKDIIFLILESFTIGLLITSVMFLSMSTTGKRGTAFILFFGIVLFPTVFPITCNMDAMFKSSIGHVNLLSIPNLYLISNVIFFQSGMDIIYSGLIKSLVFTFLLAMVYLSIGLIMFRRRDAETTGNYTINKWINYICMSTISFYIIYFTWRYIFKRIIFKEYYHLNYYYEYFDLNIVILLFTVAVLIMFLYDMATYGKFRWKSKLILIYIMMMLFSIGTMYVIHESTYNQEKTIIKSDNIDHINLKYTGYICEDYIYGVNPRYGELIIEKLDIVDEAIFKNISDFSENENINYSNWETAPLVEVTMNNGSKEYITFFEDGKNEIDTYINFHLNEYADTYYQCPPPDIVKNISMDYLFLLDDSQIDDLYSTYYKEYSALSIEDKIHNESRFLEMFVVGRQGLDTTIDICNITRQTPETVDKMFELFNNKYKDYILNAINSDKKFILNIINDTSNEDNYYLGEHVHYDKECHDVLITIIENNDWDTPKATDKIASIYYFEDIDKIGNVGGARVFIRLTDEEYDILSEFIVPNKYE